MPASEPPIVNTGNSGPMCVQPGDWICTSCGFVVSTMPYSFRLRCDVTLAKIGTGCPCKDLDF